MNPNEAPTSGTDGIAAIQLDHEVWADVSDLGIFSQSESQRQKSLQKIFQEIQETNWILEELLEMPPREVTFYSVHNLDTNTDHMIESQIYIN